tara:strand:+ start:38 stop:229 length:192 start_codon:yes stop_codon:yes gene_type:complete
MLCKKEVQNVNVLEWIILTVNVNLINAKKGLLNVILSVIVKRKLKKINGTKKTKENKQVNTQY